jgi:hypothetical protein
MSQFDMLLIAHLIGDFLLQTSWMAVNKATQWVPLFVHVTVYTTVIGIFAFISGEISWAGMVVIFIGHVILDRRTFVAWWVRQVQRATGKEAGWLGIVADQIFHIILLAVAIQMWS